MDKKLVWVRWRDAADPDHHQAWYSDEEVDSFADTEVIVTSVGFVKADTKQYLTLVADFIPNGDGTYTWSRPTKVPQGMILEKHELTPPTEPAKD